jgi:hypothetical protein
MIFPRCLALAIIFLFPYLASAKEIPYLPGTEPLDWQGDLAGKMMEGLHTFIEGKIDSSRVQNSAEKVCKLSYP